MNTQDTPQPIAAVMTRALVAIHPQARLAEAADLMENARIGSLLVRDAAVLAGIVTERDILHAIRRKIPADTPLGTLMSRPVVTIAQNADYREAYPLLAKHGIRHLVVVDGENQPIGIVSESDLKRCTDFSAFQRLHRVGGVMTTRVVTLPEAASVLDAATLMEKHHISSLIVEHEGAPVGIVTERDMVRLYRQGGEFSAVPLARVMSRPVLTVDMDSPLDAAVELMQAHHLRHLVVVDQNQSIVGMLTQHDIVKRLEVEFIEQFIAERKETEKNLRELNETLEARVHEEVAANRAKDHLLIQQSRLAAMGEMVHNIAHQWRQPLSALGMILQNIADAHDFGELSKPYLQSAVDDGMRLIQQMSTTIDDFRHFFRPDKEKTAFALDEAVHGAIALIAGTLRNHGIRIEVEVGTEVEVHGYPREFSQVLLNVLSNAREALQAHKPPDPLIRIKLEADAETALLTIEDNAGGIATEILPKIFDPYFTTKENGSGIGLYMSRKILENMDGRIEARNTDRGAAFTIRLPRYHGGGQA